MNFKFHCPHCGQRIAATDDLVGTRVACPECKQPFVVPSLAQPGSSEPSVISVQRPSIGTFFTRTLLIYIAWTVLVLTFIFFYARWVVVRTGRVGVAADPRLWGTETATTIQITSTALAMTVLPLLVCSVPFLYALARRLISKHPMRSYSFYLTIFTVVLAVGSFFSYFTYSALPPVKKQQTYGERLSERLMKQAK